MKRRIPLTPGTIEALEEGKLLDPLTPGLCTEVNAEGRAVWHFRRRIVGTGVTFKRTLGLFPAYSIADARAWAARFPKFGLVSERRCSPLGRNPYPAENYGKHHQNLADEKFGWGHGALHPRSTNQAGEN